MRAILSKAGIDSPDLEAALVEWKGQSEIKASSGYTPAAPDVVVHPQAVPEVIPEDVLAPAATVEVWVVHLGQS